MLETRDWERYVPFVLGHAQALMGQGRIKTLSDWIAAIPAEIRDHTPWLLYWLGICKMGADPAGSRNYLEKAFHLFEVQKNEAGTLCDRADRSFAAGRDQLGCLKIRPACFSDIFSCLRLKPDRPLPV